jgi:hypothetical protein
VLVRREGDELLGVDTLAVGQHERLVVRKQEAIGEARPYRVANVALPEHATERRVLPTVRVLGRLADREDSAHADNDTPRLLRERRALRVAETQRLLRAQRAEEGVKQHELVVAFLYPVGIHPLAAPIADVGLPVGHPAELQSLREADLALLGVALHLLPQHPPEWDASRRVGRLHEARGHEVPVRLRVDLDVGVSHRAAKLERRHERHPLADAGRSIPRVQLVEPLSSAACLRLVVLALPDARQDEAARVLQRACAHRPHPTAIMPRDTDRYVVDGEAAGTRRKSLHPNPSDPSAQCEILEATTSRRSSSIWPPNAI